MCDTNNDKYDWRGCTFDRAAEIGHWDDDDDDDFERQDMSDDESDAAELEREAHKQP